MRSIPALPARTTGAILPAFSARPARTTGAVIALTVAALLVTSAGAALAITPAPEHLPQTPRVDVTEQVVDLTFPVADPSSGVSFTDTFLALRGGGSRLHAATDLMAPKHRAVHAAVGGTISWAPYPEPSYGWMISIHGDDGRRYSYVHLNDDTPVKDDNGTWVDDGAGGMDHAYAPRIADAIRQDGTARGLRIERGELIGWLGDSGNAKGVASHLHFEIHMQDDEGEYRINPYHSLQDALARNDVPGATATGIEPEVEAEIEASPGGVAGYADVTEDGTHTDAIARLTEQEIVTGCGNERYCPYDPVTRGDLSSFLAAALELPLEGEAHFDDVTADDPNSAAVAAVYTAGVLNGYDAETFGAHDPLTRAQLASVLVGGFELPAVETAAPFEDVPDGGVHSANIAAAFEAGLTQGCDDGTRYCGSVEVTRAQIASFLDAALTRD